MEVKVDATVEAEMRTKVEAGGGRCGRWRGGGATQTAHLLAEHITVIADQRVGLVNKEDACGMKVAQRRDLRAMACRVVRPR